MHYPHFHENVDIKSTNILSNISTWHADLLIYKYCWLRSLLYFISEIIEN